ncbi:ABC transporter permease [Solitalea lacus]|uniref:ABC transporter permease n=1 Tax=Solitalea lacus TaxID=2911172 RepID=UPI001EDC2BD4|nr:ABC transporter permease [Solitalea lacus]UKJ06602.1 ABC transporter permease [Solitalea lacus]
MRTLKFLLEKEFRQIFRDPSIIRIIFIMPVIQLMILPWAADYEIKDIKLSVIDFDHSPYSQKLVNKITSSGYFKLMDYSKSYQSALNQVENDQADLLLEIPESFEKNLVKENESKVFMALNAINGVKANLGGSYLNSIIRDFNNEIRLEWVQPKRLNEQPTIEITSSNWFNPLLNYKYFMVPGILVILLTMIGSNLTAINIVREKEIGTIEQINVTPIKKHHFLLGKLIPFWLLGMLVLTLGLGISWLVYGIIPLGSYFTIYIFAAVYLLCVLGLGLLISTYAGTQQQAMLISFFLMMVFILLGGLYTSIDSMPHWAQVITKFNPVAYFIDVMRMVVLKGSSIRDISYHFGIMILFALFFNSWAIWNYRKTS